MKYLLSVANQKWLAQFAQRRVLLAFDFDGTLSPIVVERERAGLRARTARLFTEICTRYPCAVISGRSRADIAQRLSGVPVKHLVGNHGIEPFSRRSRFEKVMAEARDQLQSALLGCKGLEIEDKRFSLSIHYRKSRQKALARRRIEQALAALQGRVRNVPGKLVVNVLPLGAPSKGDAILRLHQSERADSVLYVGDDVTDEDVFRLEKAPWLCGIRVGRASLSAAGYFLRNQAEIDKLLQALVSLRQRRASA